MLLVRLYASNKQKMVTQKPKTVPEAGNESPTSIAPTIQQ